MVQHAAEAHIVSAVAQGEAPEWGCDAFWATGDAADIVLERCVAAFGVFFEVGATSPAWCAPGRALRLVTMSLTLYTGRELFLMMRTAFSFSLSARCARSSASD